MSDTTPTPLPPATTDVLVVGAGPAGASAAAWAARAGLDVVLADAATFPRDKACGDGLTPRAIAELDKLGLGAWVRGHGTNRGLRAAGFTVYPSAGTYFVVTDVAPLGISDGAAFCWSLPELIGVAAVPVSVFCADPDLGRTLVRFAFCKRDEVLTEAVTRLAGLKDALR